MAPAGIVTGDSSVFGEMVAGYPAQIRDLAVASRALTSGREWYPGLVVQVIDVARESSARGQCQQRVADHQ